MFVSFSFCLWGPHWLHSVYTYGSWQLIINNIVVRMVARYAPPISYNFLNLIRLDGNAKTIFEKVGLLSCYSIISIYFFIFFRTLYFLWSWSHEKKKFIFCIKSSRFWSHWWAIISINLVDWTVNKLIMIQSGSKI